MCVCVCLFGLLALTVILFVQLPISLQCSDHLPFPGEGSRPRSSGTAGNDPSRSGQSQKTVDGNEKSKVQASRWSCQGAIKAIRGPGQEQLAVASQTEGGVPAVLPLVMADGKTDGMDSAAHAQMKADFEKQLKEKDKVSHCHTSRYINLSCFSLLAQPLFTTDWAYSMDLCPLSIWLMYGNLVSQRCPSSIFIEVQADSD